MSDLSDLYNSQMLWRTYQQSANPFNFTNFMQPNLSPLASQWDRNQQIFHSSPYNQTVAATSHARQQAINDLLRAQTERMNDQRGTYQQRQLYGNGGLYSPTGAVSDLYGGQAELYRGQGNFYNQQGNAATTRANNQSQLIEQLFGPGGFFGGDNYGSGSGLGDVIRNLTEIMKGRFSNMQRF